MRRAAWVVMLAMLAGVGGADPSEVFEHRTDASEPSPSEISVEELRRRPLRGVGPVRIVVEELSEAGKQNGLNRDSIKAIVELRLRKNDVGLGGEETIPYLYINVNVVASPEWASYGVDLAVKQSVAINATGVRCYATTYDKGCVGYCRPSRLRYEMSESLEELVDLFSNDYLAANEKVELVAERAVDLPDDIRGLTTLKDAQAEELAKREGVLNLNGLTTLSDAQAEALGKHRGTLYLNGLTTLTDAQAEELAKHEGVLYLTGLTSLTDVQAEAFAKHEGVLLSLDGLTTLTDKAAAKLRANEAISLPDKFKR